MELPAEVEKATDEAAYVGAFENEHGELLIYTYRDEPGVLWHSDFDWTPCPVIDGVPKGMIVDQAEHFFLSACWIATHPLAGIPGL